MRRGTSSGSRVCSSSKIVTDTENQVAEVVAVRPAASAGMPATVALSAVGLGALLSWI